MVAAVCRNCDAGLVADIGSVTEEFRNYAVGLLEYVHAVIDYVSSSNNVPRNYVMCVG